MCEHGAGDRVPSTIQLQLGIDLSNQLCLTKASKKATRDKPYQRQQCSSSNCKYKRIAA